MAKIFVRERNRIHEGDGKPRYAVVASQGSDVKFFKAHLRMGELKTIAESIGAEIVELPRGKGDHMGQEGGGGKKRQGRKRFSERADA